jgi:hypothetical protein
VAQSPAERRRAQRANAKAVHKRGRYHNQLPKVITEPSRTRQIQYAESLFADPTKIQTEEDRKIAARYASYAYWESQKPGIHPNADQSWFDIGKDYFYHGQEN